MKIKELSQKVALGGSVTLASVGLPACSDNGAVDPAPPPIKCEAVGEGASLTATATLDQTTVLVQIQETGQAPDLPYYFARWDAAPQVTGLDGVSLTEVALDPNDNRMVKVELELESAGTTSASFTLEGTLTDSYDTKCAVTRTFTLTITGGAVEIALQRRRLPLEERQPAAIEIVRRRALAVELRASGAEGAERVRWSVTAGKVVRQRDDRVTWLLPDVPGLYQAELLVERGGRGLAIDTLALEVA